MKTVLASMRPNQPQREPLIGVKITSESPKLDGTAPIGAPTRTGDFFYGKSGIS